MKLIIQIPCFNEDRQLAPTLSHLPREVAGFDAVEWLIIDDGSTDRTVEVARQNGVDHVVRLTNHKGLAAAFQAGLDAGLKLGADVIVNTDADNQYDGADIPKLVEPIVRGQADMVVGDRRVGTIEHFSAGKKLLQRVGSWVVRQASATAIPDTTSGFRAYNREAALQMQVVSKFTYTLETIIQAGKLLVAVDHVPVRTNPTTRESRLFPSIGAYVRRNALTIFRVWAQYEPLKLFWTGALILGLPALALFIRFLVLFIAHGGKAGHVQSLILGAVLFFGAMLLGALGVIGDLLDAERTLTQRMFERVRRIELQLGVEPSHYEPGATADAPGATADAPGATADAPGATAHEAGQTTRESAKTAAGERPGAGDESPPQGAADRKALEV
jgi:glycosyltransferase involved in cell wall biosynthesis